MKDLGYPKAIKLTLAMHSSILTKTQKYIGLDEETKFA